MADTILTTLDVDGATFVPMSDYQAMQAEVERLRVRVNELEDFVQPQVMAELALRYKAESALATLRARAKAVCEYDWSDNDDDGVEAVTKLRTLLDSEP